MLLITDNKTGHGQATDMKTDDTCTLRLFTSDLLPNT